MPSPNIIGGQKKIASNTIFLYLRLLITIAVSLYTARIVLDKLGVENYGIYNIVGSIVVSFVFINNALMSAIQRYYSYHIGLGNSCKRVFSMSINLQILLGLIVVLLLETLGLWVFKYHLNIPVEREHAALIVYQLSIATFVVNFIRIPYQALIIAKEKMSAFAYFSIIEVVLKLIIVYLLVYLNYDKLILYGWLVLAVTIIVNSLYIVYCKCNFHDCHYHFNKDASLFREMIGFTSWNFIGGLAGAIRNEGPNYLLNLFLGVQVNAGMGIAKQVSGTAYNFSSSFQSAFNPQIVKSYAAKEYNYLYTLIFRTTKISFFLIYIIAIPIIFCDDLFKLWLTVIPPYTRSFCNCFLIAEIISSITSPLWMTAHAIGNIRKYQLTLSLLNIMIIPFAYILLYMNAQPYWVVASLIIINIGILIYRVEYLRKRINMDCNGYYQLVLKLLFVVPLLTIPIIWGISIFCNGLCGILVLGLLSLIINCSVFYLYALDKEEKDFIKKIIKKYLIKG